MNDSTPTPDPDDLLRRSLRGEADGVEASEELLDRTLSAAARPVVRPGRRLVAAAAVAVVAIGVAVALVVDDAEQQVDSQNAPSSTTTAIADPGPSEGLTDLLGTVFGCDSSIATSVFVAPDASAAELEAVVMAMSRDGQEPISWTSDQVRSRLLDLYGDDPEALEVIDASEVPSGVFTGSLDLDSELAVRAEVSDLPGVEYVMGVDCRDHTDTDRPTTVALVREDGVLAVVDVETGEQRELYSHGDPRDDSQEGGPYFVDWAELSPDGLWVYFSTCCEPAVGTTYRIPVAGGEPELVNQGAYPRVSLDGRYLATSGCQFVYITTLDSRESTYLETGELCVGHLAWSPDGRRLAATTSTGPSGDRQVLLFDWDGTSLTPADIGKPDNPGSFVSWLPDGMLNIVSGGPVDDDRTLSQDVSYQWLLWVDEAGVVREQAGFESSERTPIEGLPEALVADW